MQDIDAAEYGVVVNQERHYSVWPTHHALPSGYQFAGQVGTRAEMDALLAQQFVETAPAGYFSSATYVESNWTP